jgi:hypothetical protein
VAKPFDLFAWFRNRKERGKVPNSKAVLDSWLNDIEKDTKIDTGRISWLVASTVATAVLQRAVQTDGTPRFLLKGGTYINYLLNWTGRTTKDVDGIVSGDLDDFIVELDKSRTEEWGPFTIERSEVEVIEVPGKAINPRRFHLYLQLRGVTWRKVKIEISPDEAGAASHPHPFIPADLKSLGIPTPDQLVGMALRFQIAQKFHACTDPHHPPESVNERARDVADLVLLKRLEPALHDTEVETLKGACEAVFADRKSEAEQLDRVGRDWPPVVVAHPGWDMAYAKGAEEAGLELSLEEAIVVVNEWIAEIAAA